MWKPSLAVEKTAFGIFGVHVSPVRQHEGQLCQTPLQQLPEVMSHKLIALLWQVKPITQVDGVVLPSRRQTLSDSVAACCPGSLYKWKKKTLQRGYWWLQGLYYPFSSLILSVKVPFYTSWSPKSPSAHPPVRLSAWASTGREHLNHNDLPPAHKPERTVLPRSWDDWAGSLEKKRLHLKRGGKKSLLTGHAKWDSSRREREKGME